MFLLMNLYTNEGDSRSNATPFAISSTFGISKNGLHLYYDIIDSLRFDYFFDRSRDNSCCLATRNVR